MEMISVYDERFKEYGRIIREYDATELVQLAMKVPDSEGVSYSPSMEKLEKKEILEYFSNTVFGGFPVQIGCCYGHNRQLNALEYHRTSEINIATQEVVLLLAKRADLEEDFRMHTDKVKAFILPANTPVELYASTLHYAPCQTTDAGFQCIVILPRDTNCEYSIDKTGAKGEEKLLFARNKWVVAHKEAGLANEGAFEGLYGENIRL